LRGDGVGRSLHGNRIHRRATAGAQQQQAAEQETSGCSSGWLWKKPSMASGWNTVHEVDW